MSRNSANITFQCVPGEGELSCWFDLHVTTTTATATATATAATTRPKSS